MAGKSKRKQKIPHLPTKVEIRLACQQIQAKWTKSLEVQRRDGSFEPYQVPIVIRVTDHRVRRETWNTPDNR